VPLNIHLPVDIILEIYKKRELVGIESLNYVILLDL
jgi:hypothetical protein